MSAIIAFTMVSCSDTKSNQNPLLTEFSTPHSAPPFSSIKTEHYAPAIDAAMVEARAEIDALINSTQEPTFENTLEALAFSGKRLDDVASIAFNLNHAETNPELQKVIREIAPKLTDFQNDINLNEKLFARVKHVYDQTDRAALNPEQLTLLDKTYQGFVRSGANLSDDKKQEYRRVTRELSELSLQFDENVLAETNGFYLHLTNKEELAGLPQSLIDAAAIAAQQKELEGWVITLHAPMYIPFLKFSEQRDLREKIYKVYTKRGLSGNDNDNTKLIEKTVNLRLQLAQILGYSTYADYVLEQRMAQSPDEVLDFLKQLVDASLPVAKKEVKEVQEFAKSIGVGHRIEKWDWAFYTEKLKSKLFSLNEEELKPYFQLEKVQEGAFLLASKLYGISFKPVSNVPVYHEDVKVFEVYDKDNSLLSLLYLDFFPRESKSGGAWMTSYRSQSIKDGENVRPFISVVTNFTKPTKDTPSLLTFQEFTTFLHEFGHALHGMLANTAYPNLSGTSVYRDFVELPSQVLENWGLEKEYLDLFAVHYQTGKPIPEKLVKAITDSKNFLTGNLSIRQLGFGLVDMAWHSIGEPFTGNVLEFENKLMEPLSVLPNVEQTAFCPAFSHIFAGGYAAGYYSYKWAEVLDADAYSLFKEKGIFNTDVADAFRENILSKGGSEHPMVLYKRFRGHKPTIDALLERSGLK
ncbi:MAG: M3 family metallopeptidase [Tenuifilaceae bacterium]|nr:M3 family metallopeptidase [Tenuifilaceae bacterium]